MLYFVYIYPSIESSNTCTENTKVNEDHISLSRNTGPLLDVILKHGSNTEGLALASPRVSVSKSP